MAAWLLKDKWAAVFSVFPLCFEADLNRQQRKKDDRKN
jgi:hypothetical protein